MIELAEIAAGWPLAASIAAAATARGWRSGRRRAVLNEALHEVRRPLHSIALAAASAREPRAVESSVRLAAAALERLDREINGGGLNGGGASGAATGEDRRVAARPLVEAAVGRWRGRTGLAGGSLTLRWRAGEATVEADRFDLSQALDNLIVNAIEHGGPSIVVEARRRGGRLRVAVADSGRGSRPESRRETPTELIARLSGRRRRGHGVAVARRTAAACGGSLVLRLSERGSLALLDLPLADPDAPAA